MSPMERVCVTTFLNLKILCQILRLHHSNRLVSLCHTHTRVLMRSGVLVVQRYVVRQGSEHDGECVLDGASTFLDLRLQKVCLVLLSLLPYLRYTRKALATRIAPEHHIPS